MASSSTRVRFDLIASAACALTLLGPATVQAQAADPTPTPTFDARRAMPLFPANSWRDGFYVEHSPVSDFGFQIRTTGVCTKTRRDSTSVAVQSVIFGSSGR